jgi:multidrug efflux pump subunit AcrA (membrane-fusion protein)
LVVDNTVNLFQIAKPGEMLVLANAPEETVKELFEQQQKSPLQWTIHTLGEPDAEGFKGIVHEIGMIVDPNQHTVPVKGFIVNKDRGLRAGQYVTATIDLPAPADVVELPASAIADDGKQAIVFLQIGGDKYEMRRVMVVGRIEDRVLVRTKLSKKEAELTPEEKEEGLLQKTTIQLGDKVLVSGLLELKKRLEDLESEKSDDPKAPEAKKAQE